MFCHIRMSGGRRTTLAAALVCAVLAMTPLLGAGPSTAAPPRPESRVLGLIDVPGCSGFLGAYALGSRITVNHQTVYACGPRPNHAGLLSRVLHVLAVVFPYKHSFARYRGYQCVELSARYLAAAYGVRTPGGTMNGAQVVTSYARRYHRLFRKFHNGNRHHPPRRGDVVSFATNRHFRGVGHTGVVLRSHINKRGNGHIKVMAQNQGGAGGARGHHTYRVHHFRVIWKQMPHVMWLHRR